MNNSFLNNQIGYDAMAKMSKFPLQLSGFKPLFKGFCLGPLVFFAGLGTSYAQMDIPICDPGIGIVDGDSVDVNGVTITGSRSQAGVDLRSAAWTSCTNEAGDVSVGPDYLWVGVVDGGNYDHTYTFSAPINNAVIVLNATGSSDTTNEDFVITTSHSVAPEIEDLRSCYTTITDNTISSGKDAPTTGGNANGGGGYFRIKSESPYTSLKIAGTGAHGGSNYSLCRSSINRLNITPFRVTRTTSPDPAVAGHTLTYTTTVEELTGREATSVVATDTLDSKFTTVNLADVTCSGSGTAAVALPDVSCTWPTVPANSTVTMSIAVTAPGPD